MIKKVVKMSKFICPYCNNAVALTEETFTEYKITHKNAYIAKQVTLTFPNINEKQYLTIYNNYVKPSYLDNLATPIITILAYKCPNCDKETYKLIAKKTMVILLILYL